MSHGEGKTVLRSGSYSTQTLGGGTEALQRGVR